MMPSTKTVLLYCFLPFSSFAQTVLSPVPCTLVCIQKSLFVSTCEQARDGISDPSVVPCLCGDVKFLTETVNCIRNSGECRSLQDQQDSYIYAVGLCDSNGITLPGSSPSDLPEALGLGVGPTKTDKTVATKPTVDTTSPIEGSATTETFTIDETITSMITTEIPIVCTTSNNATYLYTIAVVGNVTHTLSPGPTDCGNTTTTIPFTTTRRNIVTATRSLYTTSSSNTTSSSISTSTEGSGGQGTVVQSGIMFTLMGVLLWIV